MGSREPGERVPAPERGQRGGPRQRAWIASGSGHPSNHASAFHETNQGGKGWAPRTWRCVWSMESAADGEREHTSAAKHRRGGTAAGSGGRVQVSGVAEKRHSRGLGCEAACVAEQPVPHACETCDERQAGRRIVALLSAPEASKAVVQGAPEGGSWHRQQSCERHPASERLRPHLHLSAGPKSGAAPENVQA